MKPSGIRPGAKSLERGSTFSAQPTPLKRSRRKPRPSLVDFHEAVIARSGGVCALRSQECHGRLEAHHAYPKQRLKDNPAAYVDPRNGIALCRFHHQAVESRRVECPRPPEMDGFLADHRLVERAP